MKTELKFSFHLSQIGALGLFVQPELCQLSRLRAGLLMERSQGQAPSETDIFPVVNRAPLHTAFHYHPPIVLIGLKYF